MEKIEGMKKSFNESKFVYFSTTSKEGEKNTRPMTNFNESPYEVMWFPSYKETKKIHDIRNNSLVTISFPAKEPNTWFQIEAEASEGSWEDVKKKWKWWLLEWIPENEKKPSLEDNPFRDRSIIWIKPIKAVLSDNWE